MLLAFLPTNPLLRLLAINALAGALVAGLFLVTLIATDAASLGTLILGSDAPVLVSLVLYAALVVTFSSVAMGTAVMRLGTRQAPRGPDGGHRRPVATLSPVPVCAKRGTSIPR